MPHFWIIGKDNQPISVLELPTRMMSADGVPCYVLLEVHNEMAFKKVEEIEFSEFQPLVRVMIGNPADTQLKTDFVIHRKIPEELPGSFTVLMRPDGHIAWLQVLD